MNKLTRIQSTPVFLGIGAVAVLLAAMPQFAIQREVWPPPRKMVVNLFDPSPVEIPPSANATILRVPSDRWLTITSTTARFSSGQGTPYWGELYDGIVTRKGAAMSGGADLLEMNPSSSGDAVGWTFRPGSTVVIENASTTSFVGIDQHAIAGYYSKD